MIHFWISFSFQESFKSLKIASDVCKIHWMTWKHLLGMFLQKIVIIKITKYLIAFSVVRKPETKMWNVTQSYCEEKWAKYFQSFYLFLRSNIIIFQVHDSLTFKSWTLLTGKYVMNFGWIKQMEKKWSVTWVRWTRTEWSVLISVTNCFVFQLSRCQMGSSSRKSILWKDLTKQKYFVKRKHILCSSFM